LTVLLPALLPHRHHVSRQHTNTGRLTAAVFDEVLTTAVMFDEVLTTAVEWASGRQAGRTSV
jgi:hypothetical protein